MDVLTFETCLAVNSEIIKQVTSSWSIFIQLLIQKSLHSFGLCCVFISRYTVQKNLKVATAQQAMQIQLTNNALSHPPYCSHWCM